MLTSDGITPVDCASDDRTDDFVDLMQDQSWYNPLDISKGHRGFLDGDFVSSCMPGHPTGASTPRATTATICTYVARSTVVIPGPRPRARLRPVMVRPIRLMMADGTVTCERYRPETTVPGERVEPTACYDFAAGAAEHARNITQHKSMKITTLDPRYASTGSPRGVEITETCTVGLFDDPTVIDGIFTCDDLSVDYHSDLRNPSRYFMVFETGDNKTVEVGEAEPLGSLLQPCRELR